MRLFFAINFSAATVARLIGLRDEVRAAARRGNFSRPENLHLTLAFLGECDAAPTAAAREALAALSFAPIAVTIAETGCFSRRGGGDIVWAGLRPSAELLAAQSDLARELRTRGFTLESRRFTPHITLGREVAPLPTLRLGAIAPITETIRRIELMKSEHIAGRLTYTAIAAQSAR